MENIALLFSIKSNLWLLERYRPQILTDVSLSSRKKSLKNNRTLFHGTWLPGASLLSLQPETMPYFDSADTRRWNTDVWTVGNNGPIFLFSQCYRHRSIVWRNMCGLICVHREEFLFYLFVSKEAKITNMYALLQLFSDVIHR